MRRDTLLLVDAENLSLSIRQKRGRELDPREVVAAAGGWSRIRAARAYLDLRKPGIPDPLIRQLEAAGIRPCHVPARGNGKDLVDHAVAADLVEAAATRRFRRLVLAAGDGHYLPAVVAAIRHLRDVTLVAVEGALSADLAALVPSDHVVLLNGGRALRQQSHSNAPHELRVA
jgi:uncharacterized LabA/DUF88 family protein